MGYMLMDIQWVSADQDRSPTTLLARESSTLLTSSGHFLY